MAIKFEKYLELAEIARKDKTLYVNHSGVIKALRSKKADNIDLLNKISGLNDLDLILSLEDENRKIDHALTAYDRKESGK